MKVVSVSGDKSRVLSSDDVFQDTFRQIYSAVLPTLFRGGLVLASLAQGLTNVGIAEVTVHSHVHHRGTSLMKKRPPYDPTAGLCLGPYGGPMGWTFYYERGTPVVVLQVGTTCWR